MGERSVALVRAEGVAAAHDVRRVEVRAEGHGVVATVEVVVHDMRGETVTLDAIEVLTAPPLSVAFAETAYDPATGLHCIL